MQNLLRQGPELFLPQTRQRPANAEQPPSFRHHYAYGLALSGSYTTTRSALRCTLPVDDKSGARRGIYFTQPRVSAAAEETDRGLPGRVSTLHVSSLTISLFLLVARRIIGFLFGFSIASAFAAYHLLDEYKLASAALQASVEELQASTEKV
jgi:hypothetical protein